MISERNIETDLRSDSGNKYSEQAVQKSNNAQGINEAKGLHAAESTEGNKGTKSAESTNKAQDHDSSINKRVLADMQPLEIIGIMGFGLYLAEVYLLMSCHVVPSEQVLDFDARNLVFFFIFGEIFISVLLIVVVRYLTQPSATRVVATVSGIALSLPGIAALLSTMQVVLVGAWFFAGLGSVCVLALWGYFLAQLNHAKAMVFSASSVLLAGLCVLVITLLFKDTAWPFANILLSLSSALLFCVWSQISFEKEEFLNYKNVRPHDTKSLVHSSAAMVANSFLLGFGFCIMASASNLSFVIAIVAAIIVAALYKIIDTHRKPKYQVGTIINIIAPVAAIEFLLLPYTNEPLSVLLVGVCMLIAMINEVICWSAVACYMHVYQVHPFANAGFGRVGDVIGLGLGFGYGVISLGVPYANYEFGVGRALIVVLFIAVQVFFFQDNYKPFTEHSSMSEELSNDLPAPVESEQRKGLWKQNIEAFAQKYELTARQTEVLMLLAKGYSTAKIEEVFVISNHTVKAHVYGIYQKTDVIPAKSSLSLSSSFLAKILRTKVVL